MKRFVTVAQGAILLACVACTSIATAATDLEKVEVIRKGLAYLHQTQHSEGYWNVVGNEHAATGAAAFALLSQKNQWGDNVTEYQAGVDKAMAYLVSTANTVDVSTRTDGVNVCPGATASCKGIYWFGNAQSTYGNAQSTYATAFVASAIATYGATMGANGVATTSGPLSGMTWGQIAQGITNVVAANQATRVTGNKGGGWGPYIPGGSTSDTFSTHWAVVSLLYAETLGAVTPNAVKAELKLWLGTVQELSGAVCQQPGVEPCTPAETGAWLLAARFVGYEATDAQVQAALKFLNTSWNATANIPAPGLVANPSAMWAAYMGLGTTIGLDDTTHLTNVRTACSAISTPSIELQSPTRCTWSEDYNEWLVKQVKGDEESAHQRDWTDPIAAAIYVNILGSTQIPLMPSQLTKNSNPARTSSVTQQREQPSMLAAGAQTSSTAFAAGPQVTASTAASTEVRPRVLKGVTALAVSSDGTALASASAGKRIRIWTATGQQRLLLPYSLAIPTGVAFNRAGDTLSSVGRDSVVRLWDANSGNERAKLAGHEHAIRAIAASANGTFLATAGEESRIMVWDQTNRKLSKILFGSTDFVNGLSFSPDSRLLASAGEDARVLIFDVVAGKLLYTLLGHSGAIDAVGFSPDGTRLASGGQDTVVRLWDPAKGQQLQSLKGHSAPIRTITFSPDGSQFATGGEDTRIILWNARTGQLDRVLVGATGFINALIFDPKGKFLASASDAGEIILWDAATGLKLLTFPVPSGG